MRDGNSFRLGPVLFWACVAAVLVLCVGCVTVTDCDTQIKSRMVLAECQWTSGPAR